MRKLLPFSFSLVLGASAFACSNNNGGTGTGGGAISTSSASTASATATSGAGGSVASTSSSGVGGGPAIPPGKDLACSSSGKNAFMTYGAAAFVTINEAIFSLTMSEITANGSKNLGNSFSKVGTGSPPATEDTLPTFKGKLAAFLVWVYGGPTKTTYTDGKTYEGDNQNMVAAHTGLMITSAEYTYFLSNIIVPALTKGGVTMPDVSSCFAPPLSDPNFVSQIVGR